MRAVLQRTTGSRVEAEGRLKGRINKGLTVLLGVKKGDTASLAANMMDKIINLRIFADEQGKMNLSLADIKGEVLLVSQFTLYADTRKGRRPGFSDAESPEAAEKLVDYCADYLRANGIQVASGQFGAHMSLYIENDGPCTIILDSDE